MLIATATTVAMGIDDVSNARFYCVSAGLVPLHSPKLGLNYLKNEAHALRNKLKLETPIGDAHKCDCLGSRKMRHAYIIEEQNWLGEG
jgi:hypothetical protein